MLTLYHNNMSVCAQSVRLALAEKELPYTPRHLNLRAGDQSQPDYLKLNPKGVVPTLVHDGFVVTESIVINEYIDDAFPERPLRPDTAQARARMRWWSKQIDDSIFPATGVVSMSIAFHHQYPPALVEELTKLRGPAYRQRFELLRKGAENPNFPPAIQRLRKMLDDMESALADSPWLVGETYSLADVDYAPYVTRLVQLNFAKLLDARPRTAAWYERMCGRPAYQAALTAHFEPSYLSLMTEKGGEAWPRVQELLTA